jgi:hypothetical protein
MKFHKIELIIIAAIFLFSCSNESTSIRHDDIFNVNETLTFKDLIEIGYRYTDEPYPYPVIMHKGDTAMFYYHFSASEEYPSARSVVFNYDSTLAKGLFPSNNTSIEDFFYFNQCNFLCGTEISGRIRCASVQVFDYSMNDDGKLILFWMRSKATSLGH